MANTIQELAEQEPEVLRQQIDDTRSSLTEKLEALEEHVTGTVQNTKDTVAETIQTVKDTVEETVSTVKDTVEETVSTVKDTFNLNLQVERHPWPMLGGALVAGLVCGAAASKTRGHRGPMPVSQLASHGEPPLRSVRAEAAASPEEGHGPFGRFQEEVDQFAGLGVSLVLGLVRDVLRENLPQAAEQIGGMLDSITTKLGGRPVASPVLTKRRDHYPSTPDLGL